MRTHHTIGLFVAALLTACEAPAPTIEPVSEAKDAHTVLACTPAGCADCSLDQTFYACSCPEMVAWCTGATECPAGLEPLFCAGEPVYTACVEIGIAVCDGSSSAWCCTSDYTPLGDEYYCSDQECPGWSCSPAAACPPPASPCLIPECWPLFGKPPGPNGEQKVCSYALAPEGKPCPGGTCVLGSCLP